MVDNASTDGSKEFFNSLAFKNFKYVYNNKNIGFGAANNLGFKYSLGKYVYLLNSDTIVKTKQVNKLIEENFRENDDKLAVLATKVYYEDGSIQPNTQKFITLKTICLRLMNVGKFFRKHKILLLLLLNSPIKPNFINEYLNNYKSDDEDRFIDWASGCSLIIKREIFANINGFDDNIFLYSEDEELCYRIKLLGYKILFTPDIEIIHYEGSSNSTAQLNEFVIEQKLNSEFYYIAKHHKNKLFFLKLIYLIISSVGFIFSKRLRFINRLVREKLFYY